MKILAIDSSGLTASAAVTENGILTAEYTVNYKKTHSQTLLPPVSSDPLPPKVWGWPWENL